MLKNKKKFKPKSITSFVVPEKKDQEELNLDLDKEKKELELDEVEALTEINNSQDLSEEIKTEPESEEEKKVKEIIKKKKKNNFKDSEDEILEEIDKSKLADEEKINNNKNSNEEKQKKQFLNNINVHKYLNYLQKVSLKDKIFFTKNLTVMLKAGLSIGKALQALAEQTQNKKFKKILQEIEKKVKKGNSFAESLKTYPKTFNNLFVSMVESGEETGNLENVLKQIHKQMTRDHALISKIRGAMIYPIIVISAMIGIGIGMIVFVIPKFITIFEEVDAQLPFATRMLMNLSDFILANGLFLFISVVIITIALIKIFKTKKGKLFLHNIFLKLPILSRIVKKINLARFSRTLSSLLKTDIPIVKAFEITAKVLGNVHYKNALNEAKEKIQKGEHIRKCLEKYNKLFPAVVIQMVTVGEETGALDSVLDELANFYEEDIDQTMKNLPTIIEPVLMLVLGVGVGLMAVAVLMPMYSLSQAF